MSKPLKTQGASPPDSWGVGRRQKRFASGSMPASPPTTRRRYHCSSLPCGTMPRSGIGPSLSKFKTSLPGPRLAHRGRSSSRRPADVDTSDFVGSVRYGAIGEGLFTAVALEMDPGTHTFITLLLFPLEERPDQQ